LAQRQQEIRNLPATQALRLLKQSNVPFKAHLYRYEEHGGTKVAARELGIEEHAVVKTLVMEDDQRRPLVVLMHGDRRVSTRSLARLLGARWVTPCEPQVAQRHTGYLVGGTSPIGMKKPLPVYVESTILELPRIYINGGKRGLLVEMDPKDLASLVSVRLVNVGI